MAGRTRKHSLEQANKKKNRLTWWEVGGGGGRQQKWREQKNVVEKRMTRNNMNRTGPTELARPTALTDNKAKGRDKDLNRHRQGQQQDTG